MAIGLQKSSDETDGGGQMSVVLTLNRAILLEQKFAECYDKMSEIVFDKYVADQLKILSQEEISHVNLLKTGLNFAKKESGLFKDTKISSVEIDRGIKLLHRLKESLQNKDIGIMGGLHRIYDLEMIFEEVHMNKISDFEEPTMKELFEALSKGDRAHRKRLEKLVEKIP
jgi:rubrerythrin